MTANGEAIVIGGGLLGLSTAYELTARGERVSVVEAREGVGLEASFANGGMLTSSMADPWNSPGVFGPLISSPFNAHSALKLRIRAIPSLMGWGLRFVRNANPAQFRLATRANFLLARYSVQVTGEIRRQLEVSYEAAKVGSMKLFRDGNALEAGRTQAQDLASLGLAFEVLDVAGAIEAEPQLTPIRDQIAGALRFPNDESGDAHLFCRALSTAVRGRGASIRLGCPVRRILTERGRVTGVETEEGELRADRVVIAAGCQSTSLLRQLGMRLPVQPAKGYSITFARQDLSSSPGVPVVDDALHAAVVPLGRRLRVVGTAEFCGFDRRIRQDRVDNLLRMARAIYPRLAADLDPARAQIWAGLRPMSADGLPFIGPTRIEGLWLNTGHGHLGWTMAAGSARLLADRMLGQPPAIDPRPYEALRIG